MAANSDDELPLSGRLAQALDRALDFTATVIVTVFPKAFEQALEGRNVRPLRRDSRDGPETGT